ncbi:complement C3-like isoform X2 [Corticium candelabrum]|uniref:complement C3-like isoform X2 n=1 Tax=Corticium candelabrum TaxID=121492 RepID=UPI002E26092D|nr:complement C3-like isoform X2 [Corticium candelabrum]
MLSGHILVVAILLFHTAFFCTAQHGPNYFVAAPSVLQIGVKQTVVVSVFKVNTPISVVIRVEDDKGQVLYQAANQDVEVNKPVAFEVEVPYNKVPLPDPVKGVRYAYIRAVSQAASLPFNKAVRLVLSTKTLSVFVQTDKPIYKRNEDVHIRVVAVNSSLFPKHGSEVAVEIRNPQDVIVDKVQVNKSPATGIENRTLHLGPDALQGKWTIVARYGYKAELKSQSGFEVKDYVLPAFDVKITPPKYVRVKRLQDSISFRVTARYTYGKAVTGKLNVTVGVFIRGNKTVDVLNSLSLHLLKSDNGEKTISFPNEGYKVFPLGEQVYISAEVIDSNNGVKQQTFDVSAQFDDNPIKLDCALSPPYYRPNLPLRLQVRATYANGAVVSNVKVEYTNLRSADVRSTLRTNEKGIAYFQFNVSQESGDKEFQFQVKEPVAQQLVSVCTFKQFPSSGGSFFVRSNFHNPTKIGSRGDFEIIRDLKDSRRLTFTVLVTSRGIIQQQKAVHLEGGSIGRFQVSITSDLAGKFCVLAYYVEDNNEVVADATCVEIEKSFKNDIKLSRVNDRMAIQPSDFFELKVAAARRSDIALLAVDKRLYILNNENKLSREDVFDELSTYDKSCGYTSVDSKGVFDAVGLTSISGTTLQPIVRESELCQSRSKRGLEKGDGKLDLASRHVRSAVLPEFRDVLNEEILDLMRTRSHFPEAWLWNKNLTTGDLNEITLPLNAPDSITEWIVQAIGLSDDYGFGVAEPILFKVFKPVFVECHISYAFTRLEQSSLSCTIYNYNLVDLLGCISMLKPRLSTCPTTTSSSALETNLQCVNVTGRSTTLVKFPIKPWWANLEKLTIRLRTFFGGEDVIHDINIRPDEVAREVELGTELAPQDRCPKLGPIDNKLCNACHHHHFVYRVRVVKNVLTNGSLMYKVIIVDILKPGALCVKVGDKMDLRLPSICFLEIELEAGREYHVQGRDDGIKIVFDQNSYVEPWPETTGTECKAKVTRECIKRPCFKFKGKNIRKLCHKLRKGKCSKVIRKQCKDKLEFDEYVLKLKDGAICERQNLCD